MSVRKLIILLSLGALTACATAPVNYTGADAPRTAQFVSLKAPQPIVGLVLGAGGSRGFAHVGVIKALEAAGIDPDIVVGVSSGAIVASLYAGGLHARALENIALRVEDNDLFDFTLFGPGVIEGGRLQEFVNATLGNRPIESLAKPFAAIAAERETRRMKIFNRGNTGLAVRASASVPRLFWPVMIGGAEYVDGGLASRVPTPVARAMGADIVIAVDVSWHGSSDADAADIVIRPATVRTRITDFNHKIENMAAGEDATRAVISRLKKLIAKVAAQKHRLALRDVRPAGAGL